MWRRIDDAPLAWHDPEGAFWVDDRLIVVAGDTIASWHPRKGSWRTLIEIPQAEECEGCGYAETAVWTGREILLWGGGFSFLRGSTMHRGAAFNPRTGSLRPLPDAPIPPRWWHTAVWTGSEMIVWGGVENLHERTDGAAYDPVTGSWRQIADAPMGGYAHTAVWTGAEMIVWGGSDDVESEGTRGFPRTFLDRGAVYDPVTDTWRDMTPSGLGERAWHSAVWTGKEMIVWGGAADDGYAGRAGAYDPVRDSWRPIARGALGNRVEHTAVWTGSEMIVWGGSPTGGVLGYDDGAAYDPESDEWGALPAAPIAGRYRHAAVWTGEALAIWGGEGEAGINGQFGDGALLDPG